MTGRAENAEASLTEAEEKIAGLEERLLAERGSSERRTRELQKDVTDLTAQLEGERLTHAKAVEALREELQKRTRASVTNEAELRTRFAARMQRIASRRIASEAMADGFAALRESWEWQTCGMELFVRAAARLSNRLLGLGWSAWAAHARNGRLTARGARHLAQRGLSMGWNTWSAHALGKSRLVRALRLGLWARPRVGWRVGGGCGVTSRAPSGCAVRWRRDCRSPRSGCARATLRALVVVESGAGGAWWRRPACESGAHGAACAAPAASSEAVARVAGVARPLEGQDA